MVMASSIIDHARVTAAYAIHMLDLNNTTLYMTLYRVGTGSLVLPPISCVYLHTDL